MSHQLTSTHGRTSCLGGGVLLSTGIKRFTPYVVSATYSITYFKRTTGARLLERGNTIGSHKRSQIQPLFVLVSVFVSFFNLHLSKRKKGQKQDSFWGLTDHSSLFEPKPGSDYGKRQESGKKKTPWLVCMTGSFF